jgi:hypothetical protein
MSVSRHLLLIAAVVAASASLLGSASTPVEAAQAWSCSCNGEKKRFLASTRFCEKRSGIPKGEFCSREQWRAVYGPACREKGCRL